MKSYNVIFSPYFIQMLKEELIHYTTYSSSYAHKIEKRVYEAINILKIFPYATPIIKFRGEPEIYKKFIIMKRFLIIFKVFDNTIHLDYFIDARQSYDEYFKSLK